VCRAGKSAFDTTLPATFEVASSVVNNKVAGNVAAGSDRIGFSIPGDACSALSTPSQLLFVNNRAHSCLVGLVLRAATGGASCTALANFTAHLNWDFGVLTLKGIPTDVVLQHVVAAGEGREVDRQPCLLLPRAPELLTHHSLTHPRCLQTRATPASWCCARRA
jgi:hypothetical protein